MTFKCPFCECILTTRSSYTQHVNFCIKTAEEEEDNMITNINNTPSESEPLESEDNLFEEEVYY